MMMTTRQLLLAALTVLVLSACGGNEGDNDADSGSAAVPLAAADGGNPLFERIDADTVMLGANLAPAPEAVIDQIWQSLEAMDEYNEQSYDEISEAVGDDAPLLAALFEELSSVEDRESLEALGLHSNGYWAAHMVSVYPMLHVELSDPAAFQAMLDRVEADSETPLPRRSIADQEIIWIEQDGFGVALHHDDRFATLALLPDDEALLRRVANIEAPGQSFDPGQLASFNQAQGFVQHGSGFLDLQGFFNRLMDTGNDQAAPAREMLEMSDLAEDPACREEMTALMTVFPRITAGLTALDGTAIDMQMVVETEAGMAGRMSEIAQTPVGLTRGQPRTISAGIAFDPVAARDFARELVGGWVQSPPKCVAFSEVANNAKDWQNMLNRPIPPVVTNIRGFRVNVDHLLMGESGQVEDAAGTVALFVKNPQMLLGMAQMFSPELAGMGIEQNGEPKPVPAGLIPNMPDLGAFVALGDEAIGLSVGEGQQDTLPEVLSSNEPDGAILAYAINFEGYSQLMSAMMSQLGQMEGMPTDELPPPDFMAPLAEIYETSRFAIRLTEQGIVVESELTMKQ
jgi:hypothetical protein